MRINRRTAIQQLAIISAGAALLPSCLQDQSKASILLRHMKIDAGKERLVQELTATLIPSGPTPGAREVSAHLFTLKMLDDCSSPQDQDKFLRGLEQLDKASRSASGKSFVKASPAERAALLSTIESKKIPDQDLNFCYSTTKRMTILAYSSSQYYLTKIQVYELVPGRFHGCVPSKTQLTSAS